MKIIETQMLTSTPIQSKSGNAVIDPIVLLYNKVTILDYNQYWIAIK